jgi:hypothetical protein
MPIRLEKRVRPGPKDPFQPHKELSKKVILKVRAVERCFVALPLKFASFLSLLTSQIGKAIKF